MTWQLRSLLVLWPAAVCACLAVSAQAATITYVGSVEGTEVREWRTEATKTYDLDGDDIYGTFAAVHWVVASTGEQPAGSANPGWAYHGGNTFGQFRNPGYALIDHLPNPAVDSEAGIMAVQWGGSFIFEMTGNAATYAGQTVRFGAMADVLAPAEWAADNNKTFELIQVVGGVATSGVVSLRGGAAGNGEPEMYFFDISGLNAGDRFAIVTNQVPTGGQPGYIGPGSWDIAPTVPEPATWSLLALGAVGLVALRRRNRLG